MGLLDRLKKEPSDAKAKDGKERKPVTAKKQAAKAPAAKKKEVKEVKEESMKDLYAGGEVKNTTKEGKVKKHGNAYRVLVKPVITERAAHLGTQNKYVFAVKANTNKIEIAKAVHEVYGIKPINVNVITMRGKKVRYGKVRGERKSWKKAIVTLPAGKTINLYEGV